MQHWRGPAVLAEAGEQLLVLGKLKQAEDLLREAKQADGDESESNEDAESESDEGAEASP